MKTEELVMAETDEFGVATLTLNRPEKLNAFNTEMLTQWKRHLAEFFASPAVKVIVLRGRGKAFCAGGDTSEMSDRLGTDGLARKNYLAEHVHPLALAMHRSNKPTIAAVQGAARGAGCDMALLCDLRILGESANFAETYVHLGLIAGNAGTYTLPRLVGTPKALEFLWTGRTMDAHEALQMGLANRVVPDADLLTSTYELARLIARQPEQSVQFYRRAVYQAMRMDFETHLDMISSHMSVLKDTADHKAKLTAFQKRKDKKS